MIAFKRRILMPIFSFSHSFFPPIFSEYNLPLEKKAYRCKRGGGWRRTGIRRKREEEWKRKRCIEERKREIIKRKEEKKTIPALSVGRKTDSYNGISKVESCLHPLPPPTRSLWQKLHVVSASVTREQSVLGKYPF